MAGISKVPALFTLPEVELIVLIHSQDCCVQHGYQIKLNGFNAAFVHASNVTAFAIRTYYPEVYSDSMWFGPGPSITPPLKLVLLPSVSPTSPLNNPNPFGFPLNFLFKPQSDRFKASVRTTGLESASLTLSFPSWILGRCSALIAATPASCTHQNNRWTVTGPISRDILVEVWGVATCQ